MVKMIFFRPYLSAMYPPGRRMKETIAEPRDPISPMTKGEAPRSLR